MSEQNKLVLSSRVKRILALSSNPDIPQATRVMIVREELERSLKEAQIAIEKIRASLLTYL